MTERDKVIMALKCCAGDDVNLCDNCPYLGCSPDRYCFGNMAADALALLKGQEPRLMTLEEALGSEECWLERKDGNVTVADIALNGQDSGGYDVDSNELSTMRSYIFHSGYYGKYWRCWTSRPDEKRRAETPWDC